MSLRDVTRRVSHRVFTAKLPDTGRKIDMRPMTGREEKLLLVAKETRDDQEILSTVRQVVANCVLSPDVDVDSMPIHHVEWLFICVRVESVGEVANVSYVDGSDGKRYDFAVRLREVTMETPTPPADRITPAEGVVIELRWPPAWAYVRPEVLEAETEAEVAHAIGVAAVGRVHDGDQVMSADDSEFSEVDELVSSLSGDDYRRLMEWVAATPRLRYSIPYVNSLGEEREVVLSNLTDFFKFR